MEVGLTIKDQYQVVEHIGRGGMADVWSARDQRLNRLVAIKTISHNLSTDVDPVALFEQEAQTIAQMEHPHILPIYDFGEYQNTLYIVMRYVTGGSLEDKLEVEALTLQETLQIGANIAKALDYAHENNVIHLDLKPPNILMDSGGSPYLADFGLATVLDKQGRAQNPGSGTLLYMAPEQLVAEVIDHRADIYAFSVMLFHMLTGTLPFDGTVPLAIRQLQYQDRLPELEEFNPDIPYQITDILRQGTSVEPSERQDTLTQMVDKMRETIQATTVDLDASWGMVGGYDDTFGAETVLTFDVDDAGLLEAADIYTRAKHVWAGGNGRFLLGVSHFMMMCDYYMEAETNGLQLDDLGMQMLLRGALEYDYHVDYWWDKLTPEIHRWVCLHAIRSENAPARIRALYRLETLPDDNQSPVIPGLVANALSIETNKEAKLAALNVLGTRAKLLKPTQKFDVKTQFRGRLLSTTTRLGIELLPPQVWQEAVYSPEIDQLIANEALSDEDSDVADLAARIIGRIHSLSALQVIADAQRQNVPNSLHALALVRDEAPYLPDVVSRQARIYAWIANTIRRITDNPMQLVFRFIFALLGGAIGFGQQVYITYRGQVLFTSQRWGNTLAVGLLMGVFVAILVMFADTIVSRLKGFWPNWLRMIFSTLFGFMLGALIWAGFNWMYLNQPVQWPLMRMGGLGLAFGLIASTMFSLKNWQSFLLTASSLFIAIFTAYYNWCTQLYVCFADSNFTPVEGVTNFSISPIVIGGFLFGSLFGLFFPRLDIVSDAPSTTRQYTMKYAPQGILLLLGLYITQVIYSSILQQQTVTWDHITLLFVISSGLSLIAMIMSDNLSRVLYFIFGFVGYGLIMLHVQDQLTGIETLIAPQFGENYIDVLVTYDLYWQVFTVAFPVSLIIALGAFAMGLIRDVIQAIGEPSETKERNTWLTGVLIYVLAMSALITVFAPFSLHAKPITIIAGSINDSILWAIGWTLVGGATFICALATWQWKRWGARGLIICALILIVGGFIADSRYTYATAYAGKYPDIFSLQTIVTWGIWAIAVGILTFGALRRKLWSGLGLIVMIVAWFVIALFLNEIGDSLTAMAILHAPLIVYAIRFDWDSFEGGIRKEKVKHTAPQPVSSPDLDESLETLSDEIEATITELQSVEVSISEQETESDPNLVIASASDLETEMDIRATYMDADKLETEFDYQQVFNAVGADEMATELDVKSQFDLDDSKTEMDVTSSLMDTSEMTTELDAQHQFKLDTSQTDTTEGDQSTQEEKPKSKLQIDTSGLGSEPESKSSRKGLKIDTSLLGGSKPASDPKPSRKGLKIDTSLLGGSKPPEDKPKSKSSTPELTTESDIPDKDKSEDKPDSKISRKGLKIDTRALGDKSDSKTSRKGLKIDTSLLGVKPDTTPEPAKPSETGSPSDSVDRDDEMFSRKDETLPSRPTSKLSTSEIKKQIAEEAQQMKEEADREKAQKKPKFRLNTSHIKSEDVQDQLEQKSDEDKEAE